MVALVQTTQWDGNLKDTLIKLRPPMLISSFLLPSGYGMRFLAFMVLIAPSGLC